jgi:hypothetical protein
MDTPLFFVFLFIHVISIIIGFGSVITIDTFGLLWILKKVKLSLINSVANVSQRLIWLGWSGLVISGVGLITLKGYIDNLTWIKLFFVALLGLNGIFLHFIKGTTEHLTDDQEMPIHTRFRITLGSTISQLGWWSAVTIGFVHRHIKHLIEWPPRPYLYMIAIFLLLCTILLVGEAYFRAKATTTTSTLS